MRLPKTPVVEDDARLRRVIAIGLGVTVSHVTVVRDAPQAMQFARQDKPSPIVMDVRMPTVEGFRVHEMRTGCSDPAIPVMYLAEGTREVDKAGECTLGTAACLQKWAGFDELIAVIQKCLNMSCPIGRILHEAPS